MVTMDANPTTTPTRRRRRLRAGAATLAGTVLASSALTLLPAQPASAEYYLSFTPRLASRDTTGGAVKGFVDETAISGNGRFVAFVTSVALVPTDTNGKKDVYVRDRWAGVTELVSQTDAEQPVAGDSAHPTLSDDGRYISFDTKAANLVPGDDKGRSDVFVRDRYAGTTTWVTRGVGGALLDNEVFPAQISGNGRYVVFATTATNVVPNDTNAKADVFLRDLQASTTERVSLTFVDAQSNGDSYNPSVSDDGRMVAFDSSALLAGGVIGQQNVYVRDRTAGTTTLINVKSDETIPNDWAASPSISGNGRLVAFASGATDLVNGDTNGVTDVFLRDLDGGTTQRVDRPDGPGELATGAGSVPYGLDDNGTHILFASTSQATGGTDAGADYDVFMFNRSSGRTTRITTSSLVPDPASNSFFAGIDDTGSSVAFRITQKMTSDAAFDQAYVTGGVPIGPFSNAAATIDQLHQDFLGRAATTGETSTWTSNVSTGKADLAALVAQLAADPTYSGNRAPLIRLYWAFFLRRPDSSGLTFWLNRYQSGKYSLTTIAQSFATSSEFKNRYGNVANEEYVKLVYENVFERQPDANGLAYWTGKLDRKEITRGAVIVQFSESSEGKRRLAGPTNITLITLAMLKQTPDATLWNQLYPTVHAGEKQAAWIGRQVLASAAYDNRFP